MPRTFVAKIRKGERRDKRKPRSLRGLAEPHPITARKDSERRRNMYVSRRKKEENAYFLLTMGFCQEV